jgi:hypothetical protein
MNQISIESIITLVTNSKFIVQTIIRLGSFNFFVLSQSIAKNPLVLDPSRHT